MATDLTVANTILEQLGGARALQLMLGVQAAAGTNNSLSFKIKPRANKGIKLIRITLTPADTYTVEFYKVRKHECTLVETREDVYCDNLIEVCENATGLAFRVPRIHFK